MVNYYYLFYVKHVTFKVFTCVNKRLFELPSYKNFCPVAKHCFYVNVFF